MNIIEKSDEELLALASPMWSDLIKHSNQGNYGDFVKAFSNSLTMALNEVEVGNQFASSELTRNLSEKFDFLGFIRRGEHVTILFRQYSSNREGEWLGRMVLGFEHEEVKIFGASIF